MFEMAIGSPYLNLKMHRSLGAFFAAQYVTSILVKNPDDTRLQELLDQYPDRPLCFGGFFRDMMDQEDPKWRNRLEK